ncbi:MAG: metallophosphoesterase family protein, partial [Halieaceae bacterium]|nr:metallophosphoesterase family protein [Halieaceae bacterium]
MIYTTTRTEKPAVAAIALLLALSPFRVLAVDLVSQGANWRYLDDGSNQGSAWRASNFDDSGWASGNAELGFGESDESTLLTSGHITYYFRHHFNVADPGALEGLSLAIKRDDGAAVYVNGTGVIRDNLPDGAIESGTLAQVAADDGSGFHSFAIDPSILSSGDNVVAVEVHQHSLASSDISFDLKLLEVPAALTRGPYLQMGTPSSMVVRWRTNSYTTTRLAYGSAPGGLSTTLNDGTLKTEHEVLVSGLSAATKYYYEVGSASTTLAGNDTAHYFNTSPPAGTQRRTRIWVIGDSGACAESADGCTEGGLVMNQYLNWVSSNGGNPADLLLILGDNAYTTGTDAQYTTGLFEVFGDVLRNHVLWPVPGNHEFGASDSPTQSGPYYDAFTLPTAAESGGIASGTEAYYSFDFANIHFAALDSHDTSRLAPANPDTNICPGDSGGAMYNWLCNDLAGTSQDWIFTF